MANPDHVAKLDLGVPIWNRWREENPQILPDLSDVDIFEVSLSEADFHSANLRGTVFGKVELYKANFHGANLEEAVLYDWSLMEHGGSDLFGANLAEADLSRAELSETTFSSADLRGAKLMGATLKGADLSQADLRGASLNDSDLRETNLNGADFTGADLRGARLDGAHLLGTNLQDANISHCHIYGISAWDLNLQGTIQCSLVITRDDQRTIQVDDLEVAQFLYLLLNNETIRRVIDAITSKVVLILGRFTPERKRVLEAIREELRNRDFVPVLFDFEKPSGRTTLETVSTLAHMARFVIADITDARSVLQELQEVVPRNPSVPVQPLLLASQVEPGMFDFFRHYPWFLEKFSYADQDALIASLDDKVISPAALKAKQQTGS